MKTGLYDRVRKCKTITLSINLPQKDGERIHTNKKTKQKKH
jgi:hypothetical protein